MDIITHIRLAILSLAESYYYDSSIGYSEYHLEWYSEQYWYGIHALELFAALNGIDNRLFNTIWRDANNTANGYVFSRDNNCGESFDTRQILCNNTEKNNVSLASNREWWERDEKRYCRSLNNRNWKEYRKTQYHAA